MRRRDVREAARIKRARNRLILQGLLPAGIIGLAGAVPYFGWLIVVFIVIPFITLPVIIFCAVKLVPCVRWANSRLRRITTGIALFFLLLLLNAAALYVMLFLLQSLNWLLKLLS